MMDAEPISFKIIIEGKNRCQAKIHSQITQKSKGEAETNT